MSRRCFAILSLLVATLCLGGCVTGRDKSADNLNTLWKQGYGFNNPNPDRIKKGLKPVDFVPN